jgi:hypothetical protein
MRPQTIQRQSRYRAERTQALRRAARERAREAVATRQLSELPLQELYQQWIYTWDDLQAVSNRPEGVMKTWGWRETIVWLDRRLKQIALLIKIAERAT